MSAAGFTPIQLYRTTTASAVPSAGNLADGELAINLTDEALYFKNASGVVKLLADSSGALGTVTSVAVSGGTTGLTTSGGPITSSGTITLGGTLAVANGGTGVTTSTGTGSVVLNTSPTLVTPTLGVASATSIATGKGTVGSVAYGFVTNTNTGMWSPSSDAIAFSTAGSERVRIDGSGRVGVGVSSPASELDVNGTAGAGAYLLNGSSHLIYDASSTEIGFRIGAGGPFYAIGTTGSNNMRIRNASGGDMLFAIGGSERMRIDSSGNVGVGVSSPAYKLNVVGSTGSNQVAYFVNNSAGSTLAGIVASIEGGGNNTNSYHFAGVTQAVALWYLYGNGTTSYTSDIRVKKNVETTRDGYLDDVCKLRVVKYNWYNDSDETPRELGLIAQEVEQVFPGLVQDAMHPTKDGEIHKVLKGSVLTPILLKALQEANSKIDALEARMSALEASASTITFEGN